MTPFSLRREYRLLANTIQGGRLLGGMLWLGVVGVTIGWVGSVSHMTLGHFVLALVALGVCTLVVGRMGQSARMHMHILRSALERELEGAGEFALAERVHMMWPLRGNAIHDAISTLGRLGRLRAACNAYHRAVHGVPAFDGPWAGPDRRGVARAAEAANDGVAKDTGGHDHGAQTMLTTPADTPAPQEAISAPVASTRRRNRRRGTDQPTSS